MPPARRRTATVVDARLPVGSPLWWVKRLHAQLVERQKDIELFDDYYSGNHPLPWLAPQAAEDFRRILRMTRTNYMGLVVDAMVERMSVEGFRLGAPRIPPRLPPPPDPATDTLAQLAEEPPDLASGEPDLETWRIWQANNMDSDYDQGLLEAAICGMSYLLVAPNMDDERTPHIWVEHAGQAIVEHEPGTNRRKAAAGLKVWRDDWTQDYLATLYLPDALYKFRAQASSARSQSQLDWQPRRVSGEPWPLPNPAGEVTLYEAPNNPRLLTGGVSELKDVIDVQDRINKTVADRLMTQDFGAFPAKWASGWPMTDEAGNPTPVIDIGRNRMTTTDVPEAKFGQWDAAPLDPYSLAKREDVKDVASRTRTPAQYLLGELSNVNGEAAALDTPVPTPRGLVPLGEVEDGDEVFDERGQVQVVEHAHPVLHGRDCSEVVFDDGTRFVVDDGHRWAVVSIPASQRAWSGICSRSERAVLTTAQIRDTLVAANGQKVHAIDLAAAVDMPEADLPVDPYLLGAYLGDGGRHHGTITAGAQDVEAMAELLRDTGREVSTRPTVRGPWVLTMKGLHGDLARLGLLGAPKRIPEAYFQASAKQRLALLQGLMDTDGTTSRRHRNTVALDLHDGDLARDAHRLICSLGHKVSLRETAFTKTFPNGAVVTGTRYRMRWCPPEPVFRLPRKAEVQAGDGVAVVGARPKTLRRTIVAVRRVASVPVRCLTVSGPSHLFLIGAEHVPTHNTLKASESGLVSKARQRCRSQSDPLERAMRTVRRLAGLPSQGGESMEIIWRNPEFRTEGELVDALQKMATLGVPREALWERWGATPTEIARWRIMQREEQRRNDMQAILAERYRLAAVRGDAIAAQRQGGAPPPAAGGGKSAFGPSGLVADIAVDADKDGIVNEDG